MGVCRDANRRFPRVQHPFSASTCSSMLPTQTLPVNSTHCHSYSARDPSPPRQVVQQIRPGKSPDTPQLVETDQGEKELASVGIQVAPLPWNRFFFPGREQKANKDSQNPFFEYIDVCIPPKFSVDDLPKRVVRTLQQPRCLPFDGFMHTPALRKLIGGLYQASNRKVP